MVSESFAVFMHGLINQQLAIAGHQISLALPADPEELLTDAVKAEELGDPYWGILWPAARDTARCILQQPWKPGTNALEVGCGAGLTGIAALTAGLNVTFSDVVPAAVNLSLHNARLNGFEEATGLTLDWCDAVDSMSFDFVLASDVLYEVKLHRPLLNFARSVLRPGGAFWIGDPGRSSIEQFLLIAKDMKWNVEVRTADLSECHSPGFRLFILT